MTRASHALAAVGVALVVAIGVATPATGTAPRVTRVMTVAPSVGLPGTVVRFAGNHVPRHITYRVYFDVTSSDKVLLCLGATRTATSWACAGHIPRRYGALGLHTVEMDATFAPRRGGFEELGTFLVSDLGVTMASPATTAPGDTVQLRLTVANGNARTATNVRLHDRLPTGLAVKKVTAPCVHRAGLVSCGPLRMRAHTTRVFVITAIVTAMRRVHLFDRATVTGTPDPIRRNDAATVELTVT